MVNAENREAETERSLRTSLEQMHPGSPALLDKALEIIDFIQQLGTNPDLLIDSLSEFDAFSPKSEGEISETEILAKADNQRALILIALDEGLFTADDLDKDIDKQFSTAMKALVNKWVTSNPTFLQIRGSFAKWVNLGKPENIDQPRRLARDIAEHTTPNSAEAITGQNADIHRLLVHGPNIDLEIPMIPDFLMPYFEELIIHKFDTRDSNDSLVCHQKVRSCLLGEITAPHDPRQSFLIVLSTPNSPHPELVISLNFTDKEEVKPESQKLHNTDGRNPNSYSPEQHRLQIERSKSGELVLVPLPTDSGRHSLDIYSPLVSQRLTLISRLFLDICSSQIDRYPEMHELIENKDFWYSHYLGTFMGIDDLLYDIDSNSSNLHLDGFRGAEFLSRMMVAYVMDPYRFITLAHSLNFLQYLPVNNIIQDYGGVEKWIEACFKQSGIARDDSSYSLAEKISALSQDYSKKLSSLVPADCPWLSTQYIDPLNPRNQTWDDCIASLTPHFFDPSSFQRNW
jgi:hypothetical protein